MKDFLVVVDKPKNVTSRDVVNKLNRIFNTKKIGHTGTLDPLATGVLVCLVGKYTKLVDLITSYDKEYIAEIKLGIKTDTGDITGNILEEANCSITKEDIQNVFKSFPKSYEQTVPKYSAVKINGKKLYEYAREGIEITLPKRCVNIYNLELISFENDVIKFKTRVSKGTYIRSLIEDICNNLNVIGTMASLIRTKQGNFSLEESFSLEQIEKDDFRKRNIKDFLNIPVIKIKEEDYKTIINGGKVLNKWQIEKLVLFIYKDEDVAIYENKDNLLKPYIML